METQSNDNFNLAKTNSSNIQDFEEELDIFFIIQRAFYYYKKFILDILFFSILQVGISTILMYYFKIYKNLPEYNSLMDLIIFFTFINYIFGVICVNIFLPKAIYNDVHSIEKDKNELMKESFFKFFIYFLYSLIFYIINFGLIFSFYIAVISIIVLIGIFMPSFPEGIFIDSLNPNAPQIFFLFFLFAGLFFYISIILNFLGIIYISIFYEKDSYERDNIFSYSKEMIKGKKIAFVILVLITGFVISILLFTMDLFVGYIKDFYNISELNKDYIKSFIDFINILAIYFGSILVSLFFIQRDVFLKKQKDA